MPLYDSDGNEVEGALSPEEAAEVQAKADEAAVLQTKLQETEDKLKGFEAKDFNWRKFEAAQEEEKAKMLEGFTKEKQDAIREKAEIMGEVHTLKETIFQKDRNMILSQLAGSDEDLKKKIEEAAKKFAGTPTTVEEWNERYVEAATLIQGYRPKVNPLNHFAPAVENRLGASGNKFTETDAGKADFKSWFGVEL